MPVWRHGSDYIGRHLLKIAMTNENQIEIPQSFIALYVKPGQGRPNAGHAVVLERYEQCEDMASTLAEHASVLAFKENLSEREVLQRCHQGLLADTSNFTEQESAWVIRRLAELLEWVPLEHAAAESASITSSGTEENG